MEEAVIFIRLKRVIFYMIFNACVLVYNKAIRFKTRNNLMSRIPHRLNGIIIPEVDFLRKTFFKALVLAAVIISLPVCQASAAVDSAIIAASSQSLVKLGVMRGDTTGNLLLENKIKRCEFVTMIISMLGYDNDPSIEGVRLQFSDITEKHWAYDNIKIAVKRGLLTGYTDNTIKPDGFLTLVEAEAILINALGYSNTLVGEWPAKVTDKAAQLGLDKGIDLPVNSQLNRGEAAVLIYNSLTVDFYRGQ